VGAVSSELLDRQFPNLFQVLGGYLNQDFDLDFDSPDAALRAAADEQGDEQVAGAIREIEDLLASELGDDELMRLVERLTAGYSPELEGWSARPWLRHVRDLLTAGAVT
jgi:hypothetical protein